MNAVPFYMLTSSIMLVLNKVAISVFQRPLLLLFTQLSFTTVFVLISKECGFINFSELNRDTLRRFWLVPVTFLFSIFCNIKILENTNVETFIVLRTSTPLIMSILDVQFLNRRLPSKRSWISLITVFIFAILYVRFENKTFNVKSIIWLSLWYVNFCFDQIYIKHVVDTVKMTMWGRVLYTNIISTFLLSPLVLLFEEPIELDQHEAPFIIGVVGSTCFMSVLISYTSFWARKQVSATTFTVIGNICKFLTIAINYIIWDNHATGGGIMSLAICIISSSFYEQAEYDKGGRDKGKLGRFYITVPTFLVLLIIINNF
jgi:solute carrier family 35 protein